MLEEATLIACLSNICCRCKRWSFLVSKCSLCVSLVDMSCTHDWYSSYVSFRCLSVSLVEISVRHDCVNFCCLKNFSVYLPVGCSLKPECILDVFWHNDVLIFSWHL